MQQQARPKIKPVPNVPLILQMETIQGVEMQSQFTGVEYRYYVVHDSAPSTLYLPPEGRDAILRARPDIGDYIELLKQKASGGFVYIASRISDASEPQPQPPQPRWNGGGVRMLAGNRPQALPQRNGNGNGNGWPTPPNGNGYNDRPRQQVEGHWEDLPNMNLVDPRPSRQPRLPAPQPQPVAPTNTRPVYWDDMADVDLRDQPPSQPRLSAPQPQPQAQAQPPRPEATDVHPIGQQLAGCFRAAVDAWEETVRYAKEKYSIDLQYTSEEISKTGLSVFIGQQKRGGN